MKVKIAPKLGYCSGVREAISNTINYAKGKPNTPIYSLGTMAHNETVVEQLRSHGVVPIKPEAIQSGTHVAITAHGSPPWVYDEIQAQGCALLDCTCPIVKRAQQAVVTLRQQGFQIVIYGDPEHQEVKGLMGYGGGDVRLVGNWNDLFKDYVIEGKVGIVSQTTKSPPDFTDFVGTLTYKNMPALTELRIINTICPIVATRIKDATMLAAEVDVMFVVGSEESANTQNLAQACWSRACPNIVQGPEQIPSYLQAGDFAGVTAGTSTPIEVVEAVVEKLRSM